MADRKGQIEAAAKTVRRVFGSFPRIAIVAGSGLGAIANYLTDSGSLAYSAIPGLPVSTVVGHAGELICGKLEGRRVAVFSGRKHLYEGASVDDAVLSIRLMARFGVKYIILSNAAGGISKYLRPGDLMLISDFINVSNRKLLRFQSSNRRRLNQRACLQPVVCDPFLMDLARSVAISERIPLKEGIYCVCSGPTYETKSEVKLYNLSGADAVGMSTVPEITEAYRLGLKTLAISCITNSHVHGDTKTTHAEVIEVAKQVEDRFVRLVCHVVARLRP